MDALNLSTSPPQPAARDSSPNSVPLSTPANQPISSLASSTTEPRGAEEVEPKGNADKKEDKPVDEDEPDYSGSELDDDELFDEEYDAFQPSEGYTSEFDEDGELVRRFGYARPTTITQTPVAVDNTEVY